MTDKHNGRAADDINHRNIYTALLDAHGISPAALNWGSRESQVRRFEVLADCGIQDGDSVLDVGCGVGDFFQFLTERGRDISYRGIDITPAMVATCQSRFPNGQFELANLINEPVIEHLKSEIVVASGIFYLREHEPDAYMREMVGRLYSLSSRVVAFNSLSTWADAPPKAGEFRADPLETLSWCQNFSRKVVLRHDYHPGDFTIYLKR